MSRKTLIVPATLVVLTLVAAVALAGSPAQASRMTGTSVAEALSANLSSVAESAIPAVVYVNVESRPTVQLRPQATPNDSGAEGPFDAFRGTPFERFFRSLPHDQRPQMPHQGVRRGQGSGFLISADGLILTNNHVVKDADSIRVHLHDGRDLTASVVGTDPESDIALIRVKAENLPHLRLGDNSKLRVGEMVMAIGTPFGLTETVTSGIVSAKGRTHVGLANFENFIQTDAAINPGNSGGPLLNLHGEVVGINAAIFTRSGGHMGIGFAIPINFAKAIRKQLEGGGHVVRGRLGVLVQDLTPDLAASFGIEEKHGAVIAEVNKESAAAKAGILAGDVVLGLNGKPIDGSGVLRNDIALSMPGTKVKLDIVRDGTRREVEVTLGSSASAAQQPELETVEAEFGITVGPLTETMAKQMGVDAQHGVVVQRVTPGSVAAFAGLQAGNVILEVNRKAIDDPAAFREALTTSEETKRVLLRVLDRQGTRYVALRQ